jgi:hypothetical protein
MRGPSIPRCVWLNKWPQYNLMTLYGGVRFLAEAAASEVYRAASEVYRAASEVYRAAIEHKVGRELTSVARECSGQTSVQSALSNLCALPI